MDGFDIQLARLEKLIAFLHANGVTEFSGLGYSLKLAQPQPELHELAPDEIKSLLSFTEPNATDTTANVYDQAALYPDGKVPSFTPPPSDS